MAPVINNRQDILDLRDVMEYLEQIEEEGQEEGAGFVHVPEDLEEEIKGLRALIEECDDPDKEPTLIRDSYFRAYAQELAEDIGAIGRDLPWPACHIDWEAASDALKMDYHSVDFGGVDYWQRS